MLKTISRVSCVLSAGNPSIGRISPLSRIAGGKPAVRWTSEARASTIRRSTSEKSKDIGLYIGNERRSLKRWSGSGGNTQHLLEAGLTGSHLTQPVLPEGEHSLFTGRDSDVGLRGLVDGHFFDPLAHLHHRVDPDAASVAALAAPGASDRLIGLHLGADAEAGIDQRLLGDHSAPLAVAAELAGKPLGDYTVDGGGGEEGLNAHLA